MFNETGFNPYESAHNPDTVRDIEFPHAEAALQVYAKEYPEDQKQLEILRGVFQELLAQEIANTKVFKSEKYGAEMPYISVDINELAKQVLKKFALKDFAERVKQAAAPTKTGIRFCH